MIKFKKSRVNYSSFFGFLGAGVREGFSVSAEFKWLWTVKMISPEGVVAACLPAQPSWNLTKTPKRIFLTCLGAGLKIGTNN